MLQVVSGYAGGQRPHPTYEQICTGATGHAEVVQLHFDPAVISFRQLLEVFFAIHDPTTPNRQGNDIGSQYRSVIFCQSDSQRLDVEAFIAELNIGKHYPSPIVTEVKGDTDPYKGVYCRAFFRTRPLMARHKVMIFEEVEKMNADAANALLKTLEEPEPHAKLILTTS